MIYHIQNKLHGCVDDGLATRATRGKDWLAVFCDNRWRHARKHALLRRDQIRRSADSAARVGHTRHRVEVTHFVIEQVTAACNDHRRAIAVFERIGHADHVAVFIDNREMRCFLALIGFGKLRWIADISFCHVDRRSLLRRVVFIH